LIQTRRTFLKSSAGVLATTNSILWLPRFASSADTILGPAELPEGTLQASTLESLPGKLPLIKKTWRPPNFETPVPYFNEAFTPNRAFFVRYHLASIPEIAVADWKLAVGGDGAEKSLMLALDQLRREFDSVEISALCMCSGNRRGMSNPHVPGVQWGHGAMGNARWKGVRLKEVLARAGVKKEAVEVVFDGADSAVLDKTPDFVKSLPLWKAMDDNTLLAYEMNGEPLPHWNGFPLRVVVPGWTATYWIKHLTSISVTTQSFKGFWVSTGYRIPKGKFPVVDRFLTQETETNTPITEMVVSSLIITPQVGDRLNVQVPLVVKGLAWDGGYGIAEVLVSIDGGENWRKAELGPDLGRYAWRQWSSAQLSPQRGKAIIMAKATNRQGASQTEQLIFNPAGYHNNVMQRIPVEFM